MTSQLAILTGVFWNFRCIMQLEPFVGLSKNVRKAVGQKPVAFLRTIESTEREALHSTQPSIYITQAGNVGWLSPFLSCAGFYSFVLLIVTVSELTFLYIAQGFWQWTRSHWGGKAAIVHLN